jgi:hypothetical protein
MLQDAAESPLIMGGKQLQRTAHDGDEARVVSKDCQANTIGFGSNVSLQHEEKTLVAYEA